MNRHLSSRAIGRARWFADLSTALDDGERILSQLIAEGVSPVDTERLRLRLIELRAEVARINRVSLIESRIVGSAWPDETIQPPL
ncbi:MAG: hypothetical protein ACJ8FJ_03240 [Sphingomicrobium sp.]